MGPFSPPKWKRGDALTASSVNDQNGEIRRLGTVRCAPGLNVRSGPGGFESALTIPETVFIQLTGPAGPDGGYPYKLCFHLPPINVTNPGSGYTTATATVTGGGGSGATAACVVDGGAVTAVYLTAEGTGPWTSPPTVTIAGDGSGATAAFTSPQWDDWGFSFTGLDDAAYEGRGVRELPVDGTVYPASRCPSSDRLLFFCRPTMVAKTTTVSAYPTSAGAWYAMTPQQVGGTPSEGSAATLTGLAGVFYALNVGGSVPPNGTTRVVSWAGKWVFRYG